MKPGKTVESKVKSSSGLRISEEFKYVTYFAVICIFVMIIWLFCMNRLNARRKKISELEEIVAEGRATETERPVASDPCTGNRMQTELTFVGNRDVPPAE